MTSIRFPSASVRMSFWAQWAYWSTVAMAAWAYAYMPQGAVRIVLILLPILPGMNIMGLAYWQYRACDEYIRLRILKASTISALAIALFSLIYFFLELLGYPRLSMMWISVIGWSIFVAQMLWLKFEGK